MFHCINIINVNIGELDFRKAALFMRIHKINIQKLKDKFNEKMNLKDEEIYQAVCIIIRTIIFNT